jgi:hypothetical protein
MRSLDLDTPHDAGDMIASFARLHGLLDLAWTDDAERLYELALDSPHRGRIPEAGLALRRYVGTAPRPRKVRRAMTTGASGSTRWVDQVIDLAG